MPVAAVSTHPALVRSRLPATRCLWCLSPSAWPTGSDPIPSISRITPSRRLIACENADRFSVLDLSMVLLHFRWGSRTHMRFVWLQMFNLEHCRPGHAGSSSQRWRPQPALTELACVAGAMASLCRRWRDSCAGCLRPAAASELMPKVLRKLLRLADCGAQDHQPKGLGPHCCRSAMRTATQHKSRTGPLSCHVTKNRARERRNVRADCAVCQGRCWNSCKAS
jgi:hypothetical protein